MIGRADSPQPSGVAGPSRTAWDSLRDFLGLYRLALAWPLGIALLCAIGWYFLLADLNAERRALERRALDATEVQASNYAEQVARRILEIDQVTLLVKARWETSNGRLRLDETPVARLFPEDRILYAAIIDPLGRTVSTVPGDIGPSVAAARRHLLAQENAQRELLYLDERLTTQGGAHETVLFSRRLTHPDGRFAGVVLVAADPAHFTADYHQGIFNDHGFLGVVGRDRAILTSRVGERDPSSTDTLLAVPDLPGQSGSALLEGQRWFRDGRTRYVGWHSVEAYPLTALAGLDRAEVLAPFHARRAQAIENALLATLAAALFAVVAAVLSARLATKKHELATLQATYRKATEGGNEGFYITRPIYDDSGAIVDFQVVDCNKRGAELIRLRRDELIGKCISSIYEEPALTTRMNILRQAMEAGFYEGEMERPDQSYPAHWVKLKIVRHGGDLAVSARDITEEKAHFSELQRRGDEDTLTGLPNRHWVAAWLPRAVERAAASGSMLALLFVDLDGFKAVNDRFSHAVGDEVLSVAAWRLKDAVRPHDCVARLGGDEFVVIMEEIQDRGEAAQVAARVLEALHKEFQLPQGGQRLGASIGISVYPGDGAEAQTLLRNADIAMYSAKTAGRGNYRFYDENFYEALRVRREREADLRTAIEKDQFVVHYQPRVDLSTGLTSSMEALVRWEHPERGPICPQEFIPLAEETGLILGLGERVVEQVCAQLACWKCSGTALVPVSINVSSRQFNETDVATMLASAIERHAVDAHLIEVELTESAVMNDSTDAAGILASLHRMGIKVLVDDFGTGYSSLSQLQRLDFDGLKVDRAFTAQLERGPEGAIFFKAIITMAHALEMKVIVEGVETERQMEVLKSLHCDEVQGYYVSRPVPPSDVQPVLARLQSA